MHGDAGAGGWAITTDEKPLLAQQRLRRLRRSQRRGADAPCAVRVHGARGSEERVRARRRGRRQQCLSGSSAHPHSGRTGGRCRALAAHSSGTASVQHGKRPNARSGDRAVFWKVPVGTRQARAPYSADAAGSRHDSVTVRCGVSSFFNCRRVPALLPLTLLPSRRRRRTATASRDQRVRLRAHGSSASRLCAVIGDAAVACLL